MESQSAGLVEKIWLRCSAEGAFFPTRGGKNENESCLVARRMSSSCASDTQMHTQGRKRCSDKVPVWVGGSTWPSHFKAVCTLKVKRNVVVKEINFFLAASPQNSIELTNVRQNRWTRVCPSLRGDCRQTQWFLCSPDKIRWTS